ncbi:mitochondrial ubiquitin ligase activator of nfkb 1-A-like isoform X2 [Lampetra planeri]
MPPAPEKMTTLLGAMLGPDGPSTRELVFLGVGVAVSFISWSVARRKSAALSKLQETSQIPLDDGLIGRLKEAPGGYLPYVVLEGTVRPIKEHLQSQLRPDVLGVMQQVEFKERKLVWSSLTHHWNNTEHVIHTRTDMVPFVLEGTGPRAASVRVRSPQEASGLSLEPVAESFQPSTGTWGELLGLLSGERPRGVLQVERLLRVGATLTAVGEVALGEHGAPEVRPPRDGAAYLLSAAAGGLRALVEQRRWSMGMWRFGAVTCTLLTLALALWVLRRIYRRAREERRWDKLRREQEAEAAQLAPEDGAGGTEEGGRLPCVVCLSAPRGCVLLDCGHVCCCLPCYRVLPRPVCCPVCRSPVSRIVPLYHS